MIRKLWLPIVTAACSASERRTHLDRQEREGGRPLRALPLGLRGVEAWEPGVLEPLPAKASEATL